MSKKIYNTVTGGYVAVGDERADRMVGTGFWSFDEPNLDEPSGVGPDLNDNPQSLDTDKYLPDPQERREEPKEKSEGDDTRDDSSEPQEPIQAPEDASSRPDVATVRAWAKENNVPVSEKGRVAETVYEKYAEAHKN